jgi:hypothetical protein
MADNKTILGEGYILPPSGTTAERPTPSNGMFRYNTSNDLLEYYSGATSSWKSIDAPPTVSSISGTINVDTSSTLTVNGSGFVSSSVVQIGGPAVSNIARSLATTYVSSTQLTASTNASSVNFVGNASFDVLVQNPSGLTGTLSAAGTIDRDPTWSTTAGSLGTQYDNATGTLYTLSASDPDGTSVSYSVTSGSLPAGATLNSSTGVISGTLTIVASSTTSSFTVTATSNGYSASRAFSITVTPYPDGSTAARVAKSATAIKTLTGTTTNGLYYLNVSGQGAVQVYCDMNKDSGGWTLVYKTHHSNAHAFIWPSENTYYAANFDPRNATYNTTECNLPNKYSSYGPDGSSNISQILVEEYDYGSGNADYIYRYTSPTSDWQAGNSNDATLRNLLRYQSGGGNFTQIEDRCVDNPGTVPTTNSCEKSAGNWFFTDKASPNSSDSDANFDVGSPANQGTYTNRKDANCNRYGGSGPGLHRSSSLLFWVK